MPGQRVALNLRDIEVADLKRGMSLTATDTLALSELVDDCHSHGRKRASA